MAGDKETDQERRIESALNWNRTRAAFVIILSEGLTVSRMIIEKGKPPPPQLPGLLLSNNDPTASVGSSDQMGDDCDNEL